MTNEGEVEKHYASESITARVLTALRKVNGPAVAITPDALAPIDHFHGRGVLATEELAALLQPKASDHLLDIGCGIGGPARWIAAKYRCRVTGVDLTPEFCVAARELNAATGLADRVHILHGSALSLPVPEDDFDHAYSHAALMNISDKLGVFCEALRVLRPGGLLALSFPGTGSAGEPHYPLPWATTAAISFLATPDEIRGDLLAAGFQIEFVRDTNAAAAAALAPVLKRLETEGLPALGEHVVTGENAREWRINAMRSSAEGRLSMIEALAQAPLKSPCCSVRVSEGGIGALGWSGSAPEQRLPPQRGVPRASDRSGKAKRPVLGPSGVRSSFRSGSVVVVSS